MENENENLFLNQIARRSLFRSMIVNRIEKKNWWKTTTTKWNKNVVCDCISMEFRWNRTRSHETLAQRMQTLLQHFETMKKYVKISANLLECNFECWARSFFRDSSVPKNDGLHTEKHRGSWIFHSFESIGIGCVWWQCNNIGFRWNIRRAQHWVRQRRPATTATAIIHFLTRFQAPIDWQNMITFVVFTVVPLPYSHHNINFVFSARTMVCDQSRGCYCCRCCCCCCDHYSTITQCSLMYFP